MPANLPPEYYRKEKELQNETDPQRKIEIINEMLAVMPKHKGTDKLQALLRSKIAKLKKEIKKAKKSGKRRYDYSIPKEGAGQVVLVGLPNAGKSSVLNALTNAEPKIASYPFTTVKPEIGMIEYQDVKIQLVDLPPLTDDTPGWIFGIMRNSDLIALVVDLSSKKPQLNLKKILRIFKEKSIILNGEHAGLIIANKTDLTEGNKSLKFKQLPVIRFSSQLPEEATKEKIFNMLNVIRIYTKKPRHKFKRSDPMVMKKGSQIIDAAEHLKKDFVQKLKYARLWRKDINGLRVERTFELEDKDIIELHF